MSTRLPAAGVNTFTSPTKKKRSLSTLRPQPMPLADISKPTHRDFTPPMRSIRQNLGYRTMRTTPPPSLTSLQLSTTSTYQVVHLPTTYNRRTRGAAMNLKPPSFTNSCTYVMTEDIDSSHPVVIFIPPLLDKPASEFLPQSTTTRNR